MLRAVGGVRPAVLSARARVLVRPLSASAVARREDPAREPRRPTGDAHSEDTGKGLFLNYPRKLRELALKAQRFARARVEVRDAGIHRGPTQEDLLRIARGFWTRLRIRFKWFTIRSFRRFDIDDFSAFFTLGGLGTAVLVIVGTTTFVSVVFTLLNVFNMQEKIALQLARYLSSQTGVTIVFGSAIVPKWKEGRICFKDVVVTRRGQFVDPDALHEKTRRGKQADVGAWDDERAPAFDDHAEVAPPMTGDSGSGDKANFSLFELHVDAIDVQLSLSRWLDGRGLLRTVAMRGVRGIVDRRSVFFDPEVPYDPRAARRRERPGDINLDSFELDDFLVTVYQPDDFRPFNLSIFSLRMPRLRAQWLFYDLLNADSITGQIDGCLFSLHHPQSVRSTRAAMLEKHSGLWSNWSRLRIDGVNIDHIQKMAGLTGPLLWIYSGRFDLVADIKFPAPYSDDMDLNSIIGDLFEYLGSVVVPGKSDVWIDDEGPIPGQPELSVPAIRAPVAALGPVAEHAQQQQQRETRERERRARRERLRLRQRASTQRDENVGAGAPSLPAAPDTLSQSVVIDLDLRFKDIKAAMPIFTRELSYKTYAFARPIVAFMNANKTLIPVSCRVVMDLGEFNGSMDLSQTGILPRVSLKIYEAFAHHVASTQANSERVRNVSLWTLSVMARGLLHVVRVLRDAISRTSSDMHARSA